MARNTTKRTLILLAFPLAMAVYGCHKEPPPPSIPPTPTASNTLHLDSVTYRGCTYAGDKIIFSPHFKGAGTIAWHQVLWDFGDGSTSESPGSASHIYTDTGTYTVTLTLNGVTVSNTVHITLYLPGSTQTFAMGGLRHWVGTGQGIVYEFDNVGGAAGDSIDTHFTITVMNGGIINLPLMKGMTLNITTEDTLNKILTFKHCTSSSITLQYYYDKDSIVYSNKWYANVGHGYENLTIHTQ
jgi:hypothetical protein